MANIATWSRNRVCHCDGYLGNVNEEKKVKDEFANLWHVMGIDRPVL